MSDGQEKSQQDEGELDLQLESEEAISDLGEESEDGDLVVPEEAFDELSRERMQSLVKTLFRDINSLQERLQDVTEDKESLQEQLLRKAAELENYRKRTKKEKEEIRKYGVDSFAEELLPAMDSLERALEHIENGDDQRDDDLLDGVQMVFKQLKSALEKKGIKGFESEGEDFDPEYHEAIRQVETPDHETGEILEEFQKGYRIEDRLLRPALVAVARHVEGASTSSDDDLQEDESQPEASE
jgi:molecular chaperone GrpE